MDTGTLFDTAPATTDKPTAPARTWTAWAMPATADTDALTAEHGRLHVETANADKRVATHTTRGTLDTNGGRQSVKWSARSHARLVQVHNIIPCDMETETATE
jgi:hypothetical protein